MVGGSLDRVVDANANRAREALRVLEDLHRLGTGGDPEGAALLKGLRHHLARAFATVGIARAALLSARDSANDPGRPRSVVGSYRDVQEMEAANWKRLQEALRVLEEAFRLSDLAAARRIASLRFSAYEMERALTLAGGRMALLASIRLYLIATPRSEGPSLESVVARALEGGVGMVQLRAVSGGDREILGLARAIGPVCRRARIPFLVNDRPDLAVLAQADGVHVGQSDLPVALARRIVGPGRIVGLSTHSIRQALAAAAQGADYVGFGPIHPTPTKPGRPAIGLSGLRTLAKRLSIPFFAIGGVNRRTLPAILRSGATRFSVSSAILDSEDPRKEARDLMRLLRSSHRHAD